MLSQSQETTSHIFNHFIQQEARLPNKPKPQILTDYSLINHSYLPLDLLFKLAEIDMAPTTPQFYVYAVHVDSYADLTLLEEAINNEETYSDQYFRIYLPNYRYFTNTLVSLWSPSDHRKDVSHMITLRTKSET